MPIKVETLALGDLATNSYIVTDTASGEVAIVDPALESPLLFGKLEGKNVKYILLTHGHFDHIMGVKALKERTGAQVVVHSLDAPMLLDDDISLFKYQFPYTQMPTVTADITVEDGSVLTLGETSIRVMHTPGHTLGGACYVIDSDCIIFTGDTLFRLSAGRTDFYGGNPREELRSLSYIASLDGDYIVYPGHNEATTLQFERENNHYIILSKRR